MIQIKIIIFTIVSLILISIVPQSLGQLVIGDQATHSSLDIIIDDEGNAHVIHEITNGSFPRTLVLIHAENSNLTVQDSDGVDVEHGISESQESDSVVIFPTNYNVFVEYDLENIVKTENGISKLDLNYNSSITVYFPENIDLVFQNENPINLSDSKKILCHGCSITLEYIHNEPKILQTVNWEDKKFDVLIRTLGEVSSFNFDQPSKSISFDLVGDNQFVTLLIPLELLGNPYQVYLDDDQILNHPIFNNGTQVGLSVRPSTSGTVQIIGTSVIPEFPLFLPLIFGIVMVLGLQMKNKLILR